MVFNHYLGHFKVDTSLHTIIFSGVPIFFFLAGIFISMSFSKNNDVFNFFRNRVLKVFPVMWISIILGFLLLLLSGYVLNVSAFDIIGWLVFYMFYPLYTPDWLRGYGVGALNGALWIIPTQLTFYLFAVLFLSFVKKNRSLWIVVLFVILTAIQLLMQKIVLPTINIAFFTKVFESSFFVHFPMFLFGMFVYFNFDFFYKITKNKFWLFFILHLGFFCCVYYLLGMQDLSASATSKTLLRYPFMITMGLFVLSIGYTIPNLSQKLLRRNDISYCLYVFHMPIANVVLYKFGTGFFNMSLAVFATVSVSIFVYYFIEKRLLCMKKNTLR